MTKVAGEGGTLRLLLPQWQGGNVPSYFLGSQLLAQLAPAARGPVEAVPVPAPRDGQVLDLEDGMLARAALLQQARSARRAIEKHRPDRIETLGGDCLADLAPMAYLNARYGGDLGVLWVDAHPDVQTPKDTPQGNAQVLGALLKRGDPDLVEQVEIPLRPSHVIYAGLNEWTPGEAEVIDGLGLRHAGAEALADTSAPVLDWIEAAGITKLAIHFDVDVLDPLLFEPQLMNMPDAPPDFLAGVPRGRMSPDHVVRLLHDVDKACDIVGLAVTEFMPWRAETARSLLAQLPFPSGRRGRSLGR